MTIKSWQEQRQELYITGTDCVFAIKFFCPHLMKKGTEHFFETYGKTKFQFYWGKKMSIEKLKAYQNYIENNKMKEGKKREEEVKKRAEGELDIKLIANGENLAIHKEYNIGATPDFFIESHLEYEGRGVFECKISNPICQWVCEKYGKKENLNLEQEDPLSIKERIEREKKIRHEFQVNLQLLCTGLKWGILATANKKYDTIGSEIVNIEYTIIKENKKVQEYLIEASKVIKKWFEDIENEVIKAPEYDPRNDKDCFIADLLELREQGSLDWRVYRYNELKSYVDEFDKLKDSIILTINNKVGLENYEETLNVSGQSYFLSRQVYKDTLWDAESLDKEHEKRKLALEELKEVEAGFIKTTGKTRLIIKEYKH